MVVSYKNPSKNIIKYVKNLRLKKYRQKEDVFLIEGYKGIVELLKSSYNIKFLIISLKIYNKLKLKINNSKLFIYIVNENVLCSIGTLKNNNDGIAIVKKKEKEKLILKPTEYYLALDKISDPGNLGTIIRICDWYNIKNIICSKDTVDAYNPKVIQASMGSLLRINIYYYDLEEFLKKSTISIIAATLKGENINNFKFKNGGILLIGNESTGISSNLLSCVNKELTIPKYGKADSLNAAIATGIICDRWRNYTNN